MNCPKVSSYSLACYYSLSFHEQRIYIYLILNRLQNVQCFPQISQKEPIVEN